MKIRCLLLTGSVVLLQFTASQLNASVGFVQALRLKDNDGLPPGQTYFIDSTGALETVENAAQKKIKAQAEQIKKDKEEKLNKQKEDYKNQIAKFSKGLVKEDFQKS